MSIFSPNSTTITASKAIYSFCMAAYQLNYPLNSEHVGQILRIQRSNLMLNLISLISDGIDMGALLYGRVVYQSGEQAQKWYRSKFFLTTAMGAFVLIPFIITPYVVHRINSIGWSVLAIEQVAQWILLNRIVANLTLSVSVSNQQLIHKASYITSFMSQAVSLVYIFKALALRSQS